MNRALDPEIAAFIDRMRADWRAHPPLDEMPIEQARAVAEIVRAPWRQGGPAMAEARDLMVPLPGGRLRIRLHRPVGAGAGAAPAMLYLHGGGFVYFSLDTHGRLMREYAAAGGFAVIGVDYPLAPEHRFPVALDLLAELVDWLGEHGAAIGVDAGRLAIGGDSAGANLAFAAALRLRDRDDTGCIRALLLNYGAFDAKCSDAAEAAYGGADAILNSAEMDFYFAQYLRSADDAANPYACPGAASDLSALPPAFFAIPEFDVLREQSETLAARMLSAGGRVGQRLYPGTTHSFLEAMSVAAVARQAIADGADWIARRIIK